MAATITPVTVMPNNATNLKNMSKSPVLTANLVDMQFISVTSVNPVNATPLLTKSLAFSAFAPMAARTTYSPKMIAMMADEPGFSTNTAHQVNEKPASSPNIFDKYA